MLNFVAAHLPLNQPYAFLDMVPSMVNIKHDQTYSLFLNI